MPRKNSAAFNEWRRGYHAGLRRAVVMLLGDVCRKCGETDIRVIEIDHKRGGGAAHRRTVSSGPSYITSVIKMIREHGRGQFQLLCANDNRRKKHTHKEGVK